jgi:hypothetical protein
MYLGNLGSSITYEDELQGDFFPGLITPRGGEIAAGKIWVRARRMW